jgi:hypothetical protein
MYGLEETKAMNKEKKTSTKKSEEVPFSELSIERRLEVVFNRFMAAFLEDGVPFDYVKPVLLALSIVESGSHKEASELIDVLQNMVDTLGIDGVREVLISED